MVWFQEHSIEPVKNAETVNRICEVCRKNTKHILVDQPYGIGFGIPFMKRPLISSHRTYALACPLCGSLNLKLSKEQAKSLMKKAA